MRRTDFYCDRCGREITKDWKYQLAVLIGDENDDDQTDWEMETGADLCSECFRIIDDTIKDMILNRDLVLVEPMSETEQKKHQAKEEKPKKAKGGGKKDLDLGKLAALREAGWTFDKIADELGCSPQTVANRLPEAMEFLKGQRAAAEADNEG